ncbi:MAG: ABC transporter substrate-binding protein [Lawsonibacter sp.]|jgi:iron complex transport system substrate-binding protein
MKKIMRRTYLLFAVFILCLLVGCSGEQTEQVKTEQTDSSSQMVEKETRVVTDVWGREVVIPKQVNSIVCLGSGAPRIAAYLGVMDLLVGSEEHDLQGETVLRDYSPAYYDTLQSLPAVGAGGGSGANNGYAEEILKVAPDVILAGFTLEAANELESQTNIPVVCVRYISNGLADETFYAAMRVFAQVVDAQERCEAVLSYIDQCKEDLNSRTVDVEDGEKLRAYTGAVTFSGRHGFAGTYAHFGPFDVINAWNVADEVVEDGYFETDLEQILLWDPDVIFLDPGNMDLVKDEYQGNPTYFQSLRAVQNGQIYTMPSFNNCGMNITYALMNAYYAGTVLFPEQFSDIKMEEKGEEILTFFLGKNTYEDMCNGGLYYGSIEIGA